VGVVHGGASAPPVPHIHAPSPSLLATICLPRPLHASSHQPARSAAHRAAHNSWSHDTLCWRLASSPASGCASVLPPPPAMCPCPPSHAAPVGSTLSLTSADTRCAAAGAAPTRTSWRTAPASPATPPRQPTAPQQPATAAAAVVAVLAAVAVRRLLLLEAHPAGMQLGAAPGSSSGPAAAGMASGRSAGVLLVAQMVTESCEGLHYPCQGAMMCYSGWQQLDANGCRGQRTQHTAPCCALLKVCVQL
jgi:hypothetical protein